MDFTQMLFALLSDTQFDLKSHFGSEVLPAGTMRDKGRL